MEHILLTASGRDARGITSEFTKILADYQADIVDIGQAVLQGLLSLSIVYKLDPSSSSSSIEKSLSEKARELELKIEFKKLELPSTHIQPPSSYRYVISLIADQITASALHQVTQTIAHANLNIETIEKLSEGDFGCVEMIASTELGLDEHALKIELLKLARNLKIDIALQAEGLFRRSKRLIVFDMDSTLIQGEVIDELAREHGVYDEVAAITHQAMQGQLDFNESLKRRVEKLKGLSSKKMKNVSARIQLTPGADELISTLKQLGYKVALISGGFTWVANQLRDQLGIDYSYANTLEIKDEVLTGKVIPPIVNAQRKAELLEEIAKKEGIHLDQVIAIGDGANDLLMLEKAGLGIAFNAKPIVCEKADTALSQKSLRSVLYLLGLSGRDLADIKTGIVDRSVVN